jgi:hypothetical protein
LDSNILFSTNQPSRHAKLLYLTLSKEEETMITNAQSGTNIHEIVDGIYRINTPIMMPGGSGQFNFNQYLIVDEAPLLFHTGLRRLFPLVREAVA